MIFYKIGRESETIDIKDINGEFIAAGYVSSEELAEIADSFGFSSETVEACRTANSMFRTGVEVYDDYTFTELRIVTDGEDDCIGVYLMKNLILVVDITDRDNSTRMGFINAVQRFPAAKIKSGKTVYAFFESMISDDTQAIEQMRNEISEMEETVVSGSADNNFNRSLLEMKKKLLKFHNYYEQILDVAETLEENENDIFDEDSLIYISNLTNKVTRLKDDVDLLINSADHLQDAYSSFLDMKLNQSMKVFTVITTIFFPLTIIVGWYGMNFQSMPEFAWKYGYIYVILLSVAVVTALTVFAKKKKWF
ncbi:MAG: hypothetical protein IKH65_11430 [Clostridia bacterium]|nr:hypothetical protein [Clostridia bacterium]